MTLLVITTGGTIGGLPYPDPARPPPDCTMPADGKDLVRAEMESVFSARRARCVSFEQRDSKFMDDDYRQRLLTVVADAPEKKILITHGTDALLKTADFFHQQSGRTGLEGKNILLTGSMVPLSNGPESDGYRNLAFALDCLTKPAPELTKVNIVLSDFDKDGHWTPRLYPYVSGKYEKFYDSDGRYRRLREITGGNI